MSEESVQPLTSRARRFFTSLPNDELGPRQTLLRRRSFEGGEVICRKGDPGDTFYLILKGQVKIVLPSESGEEALLAVLDEGDFFGELSLIDGLPRSATIVTTEPTETLVVQREEFLGFLAENPVAAIDMLQVLSHRLRQANEVIADAAFLDVPGRLAKRLLDLAARYGEPSPNGTVIKLRVTQHELAGMIGATRESVNKHLQAFRAQGMVGSDGRHIIVRDRQRLQRRVY